MKICSKCGEEKDTDSFHKHSGRKDGLATQCKPCIAEYHKSYYADNRDRCYAKVRKWKGDNPERTRELDRNSAKKNGARRVATTKAYRESKSNAMPQWLSEEDKKLMAWVYEAAKKAEEHYGEPYHVDHIVPLRGKNICGLHVPWNLRAIPARENLRKGNKFDPGRH